MLSKWPPSGLQVTSKCSPSGRPDDLQIQRTHEERQDKQPGATLPLGCRTALSMYIDRSTLVYIYIYIYIYLFKKNDRGSGAVEEAEKPVFSKSPQNVVSRAPKRRFKAPEPPKGAQNRRSKANLTSKGARNRRSRAKLTAKDVPNSSKIVVLPR